jgi:hypothetical protein
VPEPPCWRIAIFGNYAFYKPKANTLIVKQKPALKQGVEKPSEERRQCDQEESELQFCGIGVTHGAG